MQHFFKLQNVQTAVFSVDGVKQAVKAKGVQDRALFLVQLFASARIQPRATRRFLRIVVLLATNDLPRSHCLKGNRSGACHNQQTDQEDVKQHLKQWFRGVGFTTVAIVETR